MDVSEAKRIKELENENGKLKKQPLEAHLEIHTLKSVFGRFKVAAARALNHVRLAEYTGSTIYAPPRDASDDTGADLTPH